jgi:hypothetical protein
MDNLTRRMIPNRAMVFNLPSHNASSAITDEYHDDGSERIKKVERQARSCRSHCGRFFPHGQSWRSRSGTGTVQYSSKLQSREY